jgi:two-component system OmpR family response regulator
MQHRSSRSIAIKRFCGAPTSASDDNKQQEKPQIDQDRLLVHWKHQAVDLTLTQFWIVQELFKEPRQVKSYHQLMEVAKIYVELNTITAHIKTIRNRFKAVD